MYKLKNCNNHKAIIPTKISKQLTLSIAISTELLILYYYYIISYFLF